jgi:hypothetical protein
MVDLEDVASDRNELSFQKDDALNNQNTSSRKPSHPSLIYFTSKSQTTGEAFCVSVPEEELSTGFFNNFTRFIQSI